VPLLHADESPVHSDAVQHRPLPLPCLMPVFALVSLSLLVGLSTAASP